MDVAGLRAIFSSRIRKLRDGKMNQGEFADSVGVSRGAMSYYEQEARTPDIGVLRAICEKYKVSADYMLGLIPDTNHAVSDVCLETGLFPKAAQRLMFLERLKKLDLMNPNPVEVVFNEFDDDAEEVMKLTAFTAASAMTNLLLSTDEGLHILNLLSGIIFGAKLETGSDEPPRFVFMPGHKNLTIEFPLENITSALWVNIQHEAEKIRKKIIEANVGRMDGFDIDDALAQSEQ